ncbi:MAG: inositol-phosphate phosphatase [Deltaproteobacteria bacterium]|nr:inositol-phosphate phosphatase [Deltaproteobacteria bacterium]
MSSKRDPAGFLRVAIEAARAAEAVLLRHHRRGPIGADIKGDGSPVTVADREAERAVRQVFGELTPSIPVFGEEEGDDSPDADLTWVVDPIDGTISFVHGLPFFATLIALWDRAQDEVLVGVLNLPALGELYGAAAGQGIALNGKALRPRPPTPGRTLVGMGDAAQFASSHCEAELQTLFAHHPYVRGYTDAFGHAQVLRGGLDVMVDPGLKPWDLMASRCLLDEAGLTMVRRPGRGGSDTEDVILGRPAEVAAMESLLGW